MHDEGVIFMLPPVSCPHTLICLFAWTNHFNCQVFIDKELAREACHMFRVKIRKHQYEVTDWEI